MIRAVVIDDEEPARARLRRLLDDHPDVEVVDEAGDGRQALDTIARHEPDLVFLDIEMPLHSGIEVASTLPPPRPQIVFCTAFDSYAVEAFEHNAVDYLLKPVNRRRLSRSLDRIREVCRRRRDQREIEQAGSTQRRLYPGRLHASPGLDCHGSCRPASSVGGDYYDLIQMGQGLTGLAVGDVSGKGVYAGLLMAGLQGRLESEARRHRDDLEPLFAELNRRTWRSTQPEHYATLFYGVYDERVRHLTSVNAGHPPALLFRRGAVERLDGGGLPLGLFPETGYEVQRTPLQPGDVAVLCSDGLLEARGPGGEEFGWERLQRAVEARLPSSAESLHNALIRELEEFRRGEPLPDDLTVLIFRVLE